MSTLALFFLAIGLSMDAFAVAVCKGLAMTQITLKKAIIVGLWFGIFQAGMPVIGYVLGSGFQKQISSIDHWIAFILLALIGANMIREALSKTEEEADASLSFKNMLVLAVATSIDALAIGITFAFLTVNLPKAIILIGITTFILSIIGVKIGNIFGTKYQSKAEFAGGIILIILGLKILLEHLNIL
jgi:putative Mn2+ efflux pump MntP